MKCCYCDGPTQPGDRACHGCGSPLAYVPPPRSVEPASAADASMLLHLASIGRDALREKDSRKKSAVSILIVLGLLALFGGPMAMLAIVPLLVMGGIVALPFLLVRRLFD